MTSHSACRGCSSVDVHEVDFSMNDHWVTSDVRPWQGEIRLLECRHCGLVQKEFNDGYQEAIAAIYATYALNELTSSRDHAVSQGSGFSSRTEVIVESLQSSSWVQPESGRLLDFGCGKGAFLETFQSRMPRWELVGADLSESNRPWIESIPGASYLRSDHIESAGMFDVISLIHVLEHVEDPVGLVRMLSTHLNPDGILLIQVPDLQDNPFDLAVFDHCSHFTTATLKSLLQQAGNGTGAGMRNWVGKEITALVSMSPMRTEAEGNDADSQGSTRAEQVIDWLISIERDVRALVDSNTEVGLLGSSIAALWVDESVDSRIAFFVDESADRVGLEFYGRPIIRPSEVPSGSPVFIPFVPQAAAAIQQRLASLGITGVVPSGSPHGL